jgi:hypothetical protein
VQRGGRIKVPCTRDPDDLLAVGGRRHQPVVGCMPRDVPDAVLRSAPYPIMVVHAHRHAIA